MGDVIGGCRLEVVIGRGATGEVWLARPVDGRGPAVVVKRLALAGATSTSPSAVADAAQRLRAEADLLARLDHPNLVRLLDVLPDPPGVALVMPHLAGGSLRRLLDERGTLDGGQVVALLAPLADALVALHHAGSVHGDVKPDNVLLTEHGEPVLADVGVARSWGARLTGTAVPGTPAYLDPALVEGAPAAPTADVFALGVVAYEALTGRLPHRGEPAEVLAAARAAVHRPLRSWPTIPDDLADVVEAALDPDPARRPADASVFVDRLRERTDPRSVVLPGPARSPGPRVADLAPSGTDTVGFGVLAPAARGRRPSVARVAVSAALALAGLVAVGVGISLARHGRPHHGAEAVAAPGHRRATGSRCPAMVPRAGEGRVVWADVDGDRCADPVRWANGVLQITTLVGTRTYRLGLGSAHDQVLVGDWDGDGRASPVVYRARRGQLQYLDHLPERVGQRVAASRVEPARAGGVAHLEHGPPDRVRVVDR